MRLGEFRTVTRDLDNKLIIRLSCYDDVKGVRTFDLAWDMCNNDELYLRVINDE